MNSYQSDLLDFICETLDLNYEALNIMQQRNPEKFTQFVEKMKRKMRREKAKSRVIKDSSEFTQNSKKIKKMKEDQENQIQNDKKSIQMIRNRISAQNSRDRKKQYIQQLEIEAQSELLKKMSLRQKLETLKKENDQLLKTNQKMKNKVGLLEQLGKHTKLGKIGLALITLVSVLTLIGEKQNNNSIPVIKIEDLSSISQTPKLSSITFDRQYSYQDTNTYFDEKIEMIDEKIEEKLEIIEELEQYFPFMHNSLHQFPQSIEYEYFEHL